VATASGVRFSGVLVEASTAVMRSAAGSLSGVASEAGSLGARVRDDGSTVKAVIPSEAVASAATRALEAVATQVGLCAGGIEYAATGVAESATEYDAVDTAVAARLDEVGRAR
jgi:hypothetical protein